MASVGVLILDPQLDFFPGGSCAIPAAENIAVRIAELLGANSSKIRALYVSLDTHHRMHISNPAYWQSGETGDAPPSWTVINSADIENEVWRPRQANAVGKALAYTTKLEELGKPSLMVWPEHCLLGTKGSAVAKTINDALQDWAGSHPATPVEYIIKGTNTGTEMHSVFEAEVQDPEDHTTCFNVSLLEKLSAHDQLIVVGFALSHSVDRTIRHLVEKIASPEKRAAIKLLSDCTSCIPGHDAAGERLLQFARESGITVTKASEVVL